jgi:hypothetical protein
MKIIDIIKNEWKTSFAEMASTPGFQKISNGTLTIEEYKAILKQIYFYTRETPQFIALMTLHWRGNQRKVIGNMLRHAASEFGHEHLALNDLKVLGEDVSTIPFERPLPATSAMIGYSFYQVQHANPIGFLGYLFHLEFMPTTSGKSYMKALENIGVPKDAMTFIDEHSVVDMGHNKLMESYFNSLEITEDDMDEIVYAAKVAASLYAKIISEAIQSVKEEYNWGVSGDELRKTPNVNAEEICRARRKTSLSLTQTAEPVHTVRVA